MTRRRYGPDDGPQPDALTFEHIVFRRDNTTSPDERTGRSGLRGGDVPNSVHPTYSAGRHRGQRHDVARADRRDANNAWSMHRWLDGRRLVHWQMRRDRLACTNVRWDKWFNSHTGGMLFAEATPGLRGLQGTGVQTTLDA